MVLFNLNIHRMKTLWERKSWKSEKVGIWKWIKDAQGEPWYVITIDEELHRWDVVHLFKNLNPQWKHDYFLLKIKKKPQD